MEAFELLGHTFHLKNLTSMIFEALATHQYIAIILIPKKQLDDYPKKNHLLTPNDPTTH